MSHSSMDFEDSLLELLAEEAGYATVQLASVHRPTFSQQLTVLHEQLPDFSTSPPPVATAQATGRKSQIRALDLPN